MDEFEAILETGAAAAVEIAASALAERGEAVGPCPNCGKPMIGAYCAVCGQERDTHRRSIRQLLHAVFEDIVGFDSRILRTALALLFQPGELTNAFREGRTQRYLPALRLYLFVSLIFFLTLSATHIALVQFDLTVTTERFFADKQGNVFVSKDGKTTALANFKADAKGNVTIDSGDSHIAVPGMKADGSITNNVSTTPHFFLPIGADQVKISPVIRNELQGLGKESLSKANQDSSWLLRPLYATLVKLETDPAALNGPLTEWMPRVLFFLLPVFALLLALFYVRKRRQFYFVDHLVFSLNYHSFLFVALLAAAVLAQFLSGGAVGALLFFAVAAYLLLAMKRSYGQGWLITSAKFFGVFFIYLFFILVPAFGILMAASVFYG
jgi:hypothetical protein